MASGPQKSFPSSDLTPRWKYDVYLSCRGADTRYGVTSHLHHESQKRGVKVCLDDLGLAISSLILSSLPVEESRFAMFQESRFAIIEESRFAIVLLSPNYASSSWLLEELTKIVQCMEKDDRILPVFYGVDPSDVLRQKGSFGEAMVKHERSDSDKEKLNRWRDALRKVANVPGLDSKNFKTDTELVAAIVHSVSSRLRSIKSKLAISTGGFEELRSRREAMDKVMEALKDDEISMIGVYGMPGVGKTTMVQQVAAQACRIGFFEHVILAVVSQSPDLRKIQDTLAVWLGVKLEENTEEERAFRLNKEIMRRNNLLIILDDIWEMIELSRIGLPSYYKLKICNSKVLLTTRLLHVCYAMMCQAKISLDILSEADAWKMFKKEARMSSENLVQIYQIARNVARECCGLPIELISVARALGDKDVVEWEIAYERLQKSRVANLDDEGDAFKCIKLSYDYLKDEDCKSFFLLCCLFPEDYDIPIKDLFKYGYGKGLFQDADTIREAREIADLVVKHLKNSSLLMDSEEDGCVRMHAVIRDTAIQIAQGEFLARARCCLRYWPYEFQEAYSAVSLMWNQIYLLPEQLVFPKLQILLLNNNSFNEIPESFFQSPNELRVLDLSGNSIPLLPESFSLLTNLRALYLDDCPFLDDISVVGKLEKLEILSMKNYGFKELPREIGDLTNLRIFDITYAKVARIPSKVISNLQRLEELYMCCEFRDWGSNVEGQEPNASFEEVTSLGNLCVLRVCISHAECIPKIVKFIPNWVEFDITIGKEWWGRGRSSTSTRMVEINANSTLPDWFLNVVISKVESNINYECGVIEVFEATRQAMFEVMEVLKDDEISVIGVYGMGGVGKTTMVEYVSQEAQNQGLFDNVIKVVITQTPDLRRIQGTLADLLGVKLEEETEFGRSRRLMQKIRNCNKILIILEDVWEKIDFSSLGIPRNFELQRCSSKVLFTTRRSKVWHSKMSQATVRLDTLSEEDSWNLFVKNSKRTFESSTKSYDIARMIARQCDGLPVSLIAVAKALGDEDLGEWKEAARRLKESPPANREDLGGVFKCIKLSYDYLRSDDAKLCFLLCCLFPEQSDIHIEDLLKYGMGLGSFGDSKTAQEARASADVTVKFLKARNLLLETEQDGCIRMHNVIRDVAILISLSEDGPRFFVKAQCELKEWPTNSDHEGYYAISLMRNKICKLPKKLVCSKLHLLFLQSNFCLNEIPEDFFRSLIELRVLDLSQTRISSLPTSLSLLINLYTLYLDGCFSVINNISILGNLRKLEILSMREVPLVEVPKEIGKLTNLRMLDLTGECADIVPSKVICNLAKLEELYMQCNFADWGSIVERNEVRGAEEDVNATFDELTGLSHLNILKVFISDANSLPKNVESEPEWVCFDICINRDPLFRRSSLFLSSSPAYPRALTLDTTINVLPGWFINMVTGRAQKLRYVKCWRLTNILEEHDRGKLHALEYFSVIGPSDNLIVLMDAQTWVPKEPVFQKLEELHLVQLDCLEALCVGVLPLGSLCNLRLLNVKHCYELVNALLPLRLLQRLQNLERLFCEEMDKMEYVFGCEGKPVEAILGKLIELRLENLVKLIQIWDGPVPSGIFANLQTLVVLGCFKLENIFTAEVAQCLLHLEDLSVALCPMLDSLIRASEETLDNHIVFPKLKNLALIKLPQLTSFCSNTETVICCCLLEYLYVESCPQFSPSDFHSRNKVQINHKKHMDILLSRSSSLARRTQEPQPSYSKPGLFLRNEPDLLENCRFGSDPRKRKRV